MTALADRLAREEQGGLTLNAVELSTVRNALKKAPCWCHLYVEVTKPKHSDQGACPRCKALAIVDPEFAAALARAADEAGLP